MNGCFSGPPREVICTCKTTVLPRFCGIERIESSSGMLVMCSSPENFTECSRHPWVPLWLSGLQKSTEVALSNLQLPANCLIARQLPTVLLIVTWSLYFKLDYLRSPLGLGFFKDQTSSPRKWNWNLLGFFFIHFFFHFRTMGFT